MFSERYYKELVNGFNHILEYRNYEDEISKTVPDFSGVVNKNNLKKSSSVI
ncbi:hypothetical protein ACUY4R_002194 [Kosakonia sp. BK9b]